MARRLAPRTARRAAGALAALGALAGLVVVTGSALPQASATPNPSTQWISTETDLGVTTPPSTTVGDAIDNRAPSVSADGRFVAWEASLRGATRVFLKDRNGGTITTVGDPGATLPALSADGCFVAYFAAGTLQRARRPDPVCAGPDLVTVSIGAISPTYQFATRVPSISGDGSKIAVELDKRAGTGAVIAVAAIDGAGTVSTTTLPSSLVPAPSALYRQPAITGDGLTVFFSTATSVIDGTALPAPTIAQWKLDGSGTVALVPVGDGITNAVDPATDKTGAVLAFAATPVTTPPSTVPQQVYVLPLGAGGARTLLSVSAATAGAPGNAESGGAVPGGVPSITPGIAVSGDGQTVAFVSRATDLFAGATVAADVVAAFVPTKSLTRLTVATDGTTPVDTGATDVASSYTARAVAFAGRNGDQLVGSNPPAPAPTALEVFVRERPPELSIGPNYDAGPVTVGAPSPKGTMTVTNTGLTPAVIGSVTTDASAVLLDAAGCPPGTELLPGKSCSVTVQVKPPAVGNVSGTVTATGAGPGIDFQPPTASATAQATGVVPSTTAKPTTTPKPTTTTTTTTTIPPVVRLTLSPTTADLGPVVLNASSTPATLSLTNAGNVAVTVSSLTLTGADATEFSLSPGDCADKTLAPTAACRLTISGKPTAKGLRTAQIVVTGSRGASSSGTVTMTGVDQPVITLAPPVAPNGGVVTVTGSGFAAGAGVTVSWADGRPAAVATAGPDGTFTAQVLVQVVGSGAAKLNAGPVPPGATPPTAVLLVSGGSMGPPMAGGGGFVFRGH